MGAGDQSVSYSIKVDADSNAAEAANELELLKKALASSIETVKQAGSASRSLRGSTDEVRDAKAQLKAQIESERDAISRLNLALLKQGTSYDQLVAKEKKALEEQKRIDKELEKKRTEEHNKALLAQNKALSAAGGPLGEYRDKLTSLSEIFSGGAGLTLGIGLAVAAIAGFTVALIVGTVALAAWIVQGANAARTLALIREAATGSAQNSKALGNQIVDLGTRVATSREELETMANELARTTMGTRLSGKGLVDTFNAVAQASEAMGKQAGSAIEGIITRGKRWGTLGLNPQELLGTGIQFQDVAANLAKQLKIGIDQAQLALLTGRVQIDEGAKAIRTTLEQRFGDINKRKLLDIDVQLRNFRQSLVDLTRGVNLEPLLAGLQKIFALFSQNTVSGVALKTIVEALGNAFVGGAAKGADLVVVAVKQLIIWGLHLTIALLKMKQGIKDAFTGKSAIVDLRAALLALEIVVGVVAAAFVAFGVAVGGALALTLYPLYKLSEIILGVRDLFLNTDWSALGRAIIDGLKRGLSNAWESVRDSVTGLATRIKDSFKNLLGIHSPSSVFEEFGQQTAKGYAQGVDKGTPEAQGAVRGMGAAPTPIATSVRSSASSSRKVEATLIVHVHGAATGEDVQRALTGPSFRAQFLAMLEQELAGEGIPIMVPAGAGAG